MVTSAMSASPSACGLPDGVIAQQARQQQHGGARGVHRCYPANAVANADAASATAWLATSTAPPIVKNAWMVPS